MLWLVVLCIPLQGFGVALARISGTAHFHVATGDGHDHHGSVEHHHHDAEDDSVVHIDDGLALKDLPVVASTRVLDVEPMPHARAAAAPAAAIAAAPDHPAGAFESHVGEPLERPPR